MTGRRRLKGAPWLEEVGLAGSLKEQAYQAIKHRIITCAFEPGQELSENAVANVLKIGRTPVHQAFDRLHSEGLVDVHPRKGIVVRPINLDDQDDVEQMMLLDRDFHRLIARAAHNTVLADVLLKLHERSLRLWFISLATSGHQARVHEEHQRIFDAISHRDVDSAQTAMRLHIDSFRQNVLKHF
jgi:DNA-binding GntR family transcriptional regulator